MPRDGYTKEGLQKEKMTHLRTILKEMGGGKMKGTKDVFILLKDEAKLRL